MKSVSSRVMAFGLENQIKSLEKAVELDPKNQQFQNQLKQAKGGA